MGRSREGAWIEIHQRQRYGRPYNVAPARERGLKYRFGGISFNPAASRSREGAWIEIINKALQANQNACRSREGAWIEIIQASGHDF